jgi:hypothetical protein
MLRLTVAFRTLIVLVSFAASMAAAGSSAQSLQDANAMRAKLLQIVVKGESCPCTTRTRTAISEREVNGYLTHHATDDLPEGVVGPHVTIVGDGRVSGRATVDLDKVRTSKQRGWLDPAGYLTGRLPVTAIGILHTRDGIGRFELQSATVGGVEVPKVVLQEMLSYYSRTPDDADGINLDESFELPAKIREIQVGKGVAYVIQ